MHVLSINNPKEEKMLRSSCREVTQQDFDDGTVQKTIHQLDQTLAYYGNGVWLSAIQVWHLLQIFVINCRPTESFPNMKKFSQVIINPVITHYSDETFDGREWCMSIADNQCKPKQRYQVRRSTSITFDYTDEHNVRHIDKSLSGLPAIVFQHEYDHLFGHLIDQIGIPGQVISQEEYIERKDNWEVMILS